jgi:hypothetical protein
LKIKRTQPKTEVKPTIEEVQSQNLNLNLAVAETYEKMMQLDMEKNIALAELAELTLGGNL